MNRQDEARANAVALAVFGMVKWAHTRGLEGLGSVGRA